MDDTEAIKAALRRKAAASTIAPRDLLSTGSTLLNLACSGRPVGGIGKGHYVLIVGDSTSGKTWLTFNVLAEAARNKHFADYRLVHDNAENGALMDIPRYFGKALAARLEEAPNGPSVTAEGFYYKLETVRQDGKPFIYVLDSHDALSSAAEDERFAERMDRHAAGKDPGAGDYGDGKAKLASRNLRRAVALLPETGSILIILSQTRDNIGFGAQFNPKTRAGGRALRFYAHLELWTSVRGHLKATVRGKDVPTGIRIKADIKKNRITGQEWSVEYPLLYGHGIDDVGAMVDYLVEWRHWPKAAKGGKITAADMELTGTRETLVKAIEEAGREKELRTVVTGVWAEVVAAATVNRKPRYE